MRIDGIEGIIVHPEIDTIYSSLKRLSVSAVLLDAHRISVAEVQSGFLYLLRRRAGKLKRLGWSQPLPRVACRPTFQEAVEDGGIEATLGAFYRAGEYAERLERKYNSASANSNDDI